jgi:hypothetical protein
MTKDCAVLHDEVPRVSKHDEISKEISALRGALADSEAARVDLVREKEDLQLLCAVYRAELPADIRREVNILWSAFKGAREEVRDIEASYSRRIVRLELEIELRDLMLKALKAANGTEAMSLVEVSAEIQALRERLVRAPPSGRCSGRPGVGS